MASLGYAVMKYESNTKNTARNVLRSVTAQFSTARTLGAIGDAKISSGLKVSSFFFSWESIRGKVHIVYFSLLSLPFISSFIPSLFLLENLTSHTCSPQRETKSKERRDSATSSPISAKNIIVFFWKKCSAKQTFKLQPWSIKVGKL